MQSLTEYDTALRTAMINAAAGPWVRLSRLERAASRFARAGRRKGHPPERVLIRLKEVCRPVIQPLLATERRAWALHVLNIAVGSAAEHCFAEARTGEWPSVAVPS
jgi:hypothetical protein